MKYRVYRYYVGCYVYDVEADSPQEARTHLNEYGDQSERTEFLHEANDPGENEFFTEVHEYDENGDSKDDPVFTYNPGTAWKTRIWRNWPID